MMKNYQIGVLDATGMPSSMTTLTTKNPITQLEKSFYSIIMYALILLFYLLSRYY